MSEQSLRIGALRDMAKGQVHIQPKATVDAVVHYSEVQKDKVGANVFQKADTDRKQDYRTQTEKAAVNDFHIEIGVHRRQKKHGKT